MKKISQILKETTVPQIKYTFISFGDNGKMMGKCALGVLACESDDKLLHLDEEHRTIDMLDLFGSYGIKDIGGLPYLNNVTGWDFEYENQENKFLFTLSRVITSLNDHWGFTFKEIGEFLEVTFDL